MRIKLFYLIIALFTLGEISAQIAPKIVVAITVEDLKEEYLTQFSGEFTKGGFNRLTSCQKFDNVEFDYYTTDFATDVATIFTASNPCFHGIVGEKRYCPSEKKCIYSLFDKESHGLNDSLQLSGKNLYSTTIADNLYETTYGLSKIVSIATNPTIAMVMAGHSGLPIYLNNLTGEWSSSSYYKDKLPKWLTDYNSTKPIEAYLEKNWENIQPAQFYYMSARKGSIGFNYSISGVCNGLKMYDNFTTTPYCNEYICDLALKAIDSEKMGNDFITDFLIVNFSLKKFFLKADDPYSLEMEDAYIRLDKTLTRFVEIVENKFGKENIQIILIGSRTGDINTTAAINPRIKYESFNIDRYMALLNSYLMAYFGQKKWVLNCYCGNIYLNRNEIEKSGLEITKVQEKAMEFFYLIPGVQNLCTATQMEQAFYTTGVQRHAYYRNLSGDLLYSLMPRWYEVDINDKPTGFFSTYKTFIPVWVYGGGRSETTLPTTKATEMFQVLSTSKNQQ